MVESDSTLTVLVVASVLEVRRALSDINAVIDALAVGDRTPSAASAIVARGRRIAWQSGTRPAYSGEFVVDGDCSVTRIESSLRCADPATAEAHADRHALMLRRLLRPLERGPEPVISEVVVGSAT